MKIEQKLENIFEFLSLNRQYNHQLQERFYLSILKPYNTHFDKVLSLLYHIANTQSRPNINSLATFNKLIHSNANSLNSFKSFVELLNDNNKTLVNFHSLFIGLASQSGWGEKTSSLFVKTIYHLHNSFYSKDLKIWNDVPKAIDEKDNLFLPVDAVIIAIFKKLDNTIKWDFKKINKILKNKYKGQQIEVWDDLWFWGFITQKGSGTIREFGWNENKYWTLKESDKNLEVIEDIRNKAKTFLTLLS